MSFNRLDYDSCTYKQELSESIAPGEYQLSTPCISNEDCFSRDPQIIIQRSGNSVAKNIPMIDVDSELININRKLSNCSNDSFIPKFNKDGEIDNSIDLKDFKNCNMRPTENTRLSNPSCNLRGTGWNRWEWLCNDPQSKVELPFENNISNRLVFKDNHRPVLPNLLDQSNILPPNDNTPIDVNIAKAPAVPLGEPGTPLSFSNDVYNL
jgi:hypothetical protein